jgi:phage/plasmid primase-like uncharacterized protein
MHRIGTPGGETNVIVEGYATGATIHQATGLAVVVAFNAANLVTVAMAVRGAEPDARIIIAGDNDHHKPRELSSGGRVKSNVGSVAAEKAAAAVDGFALLPTFAADDVSTDWNDLARLQGAAGFAQQWQTGIAIAERRFEVKIIAAAREETRKAEPSKTAIEHCHNPSRAFPIKRQPTCSFDPFC